MTDRTFRIINRIVSIVMLAILPASVLVYIALMFRLTIVWSRMM